MLTPSVPTGVSFLSGAPSVDLVTEVPQNDLHDVSSDQHNLHTTETDGTLSTLSPQGAGSPTSSLGR